VKAVLATYKAGSALQEMRTTMENTQYTLKDLCTSFGAEQEAYDEVMRDIEDCSTDEQVE
jgi:hypothetical protein